MALADADDDADPDDEDEEDDDDADIGKGAVGPLHPSHDKMRKSSGTDAMASTSHSRELPVEWI